MLHVTGICNIEEIFEMAAACNAPSIRKILIELSQNQFHVSIATIHIPEEATGAHKNFRYRRNSVAARHENVQQDMNMVRGVVTHVVNNPLDGIATCTSKVNSRFVIKKFANQRRDSFLSPSGSAMAWAHTL
jgi:hypothetical protein